MENFKHCVWLTLADTRAAAHPWNSYIEGVPVHMTVKSHLEPAAAAALAARLASESPRVPVRLAGALRQTEQNSFYALEHPIEPDTAGPPPAWWPAGAHLSFAYRYGQSFTADELREVDSRLRLGPRRALLCAVRRVLCQGPFHEWLDAPGATARRRRTAGRPRRTCAGRAGRPPPGTPPGRAAAG